MGVSGEGHPPSAGKEIQADHCSPPPKPPNPYSHPPSVPYFIPPS